MSDQIATGFGVASRVVLDDAVKVLDRHGVAHSVGDNVQLERSGLRK